MARRAAPLSPAARPWFGGRLMVSRAHALLDSGGALADAATRDRLAGFLAGFVAFVRAPGNGA